MKFSKYLEPDWIRTSEPRILLLKKQLEYLLELIELEKDGKIVEIDGFRLKNNEDWIVPLAANPVTSLLSELASPCNINCTFCYLKGLPDYKTCRGYMRDFYDLKTKIKYISLEKSEMLFSALSPVEEQLRHPRFFEILELLREKFDDSFDLLTNGSNLTEEFIAKLAKYKPVTITVSINSATPEIRKRIMNDKLVAPLRATQNDMSSGNNYFA